MTARAVGAALALLAAACGAATAPAQVAPPIADVSGTNESGERVALLRPGAQGTIVVFIRGLVSEESQRTADDAGRLLRDALGCDPLADLVVVLEPGVAGVWPGFKKEIARQMSVYRRWRAKCLGGGDVASEAGDREAKEQITLVMDEEGAIRREALAGGDAEHDLVFVVYADGGRALYRAPLVRPALERTIDAALRALRAAR